MTGAIATGIATLTDDGAVLDTWFPEPALDDEVATTGTEVLDLADIPADLEPLVGTDALRRTVRLADGKLTAPSKNRVTDLFGSQIRPVVRDPTRLQLFKDNPRLTLFEGSDGSFKTVDAYEQTIGLGDAKLLSSAVTVEPANRTVIVAARLGKGRIIRTGMPSFEVRVATDDDPALTALMERLWVLLSR